MNTNPFTAPFSASFSAPFSGASPADLHQAAVRALAIQKEAGDLLLAQTRIASEQLAATLEHARSAAAVQHNAAMAMAKVYVDALTPAKA